MTKKEKDAKERMYQDAIIWICSTSQKQITKGDLFEWIEKTGHNRPFKGPYCGGANKIKEALLNRANPQQVAVIKQKLRF